MPSGRCVVFECSSRSDKNPDISLHTSPLNKTQCDKWKRFVRFRRANFNPSSRFVICSTHFEDGCFSRAVHENGAQRRLLLGAIPTIWNWEFIAQQQPLSERSRENIERISSTIAPKSKNKVTCICFYSHLRFNKTVVVYLTSSRDEQPQKICFEAFLLLID